MLLKSIISIVVVLILMFLPVISKSIITLVGLGFNFYLLFLSSMFILIQEAKSIKLQLYKRISTLFFLMTILTSLYPTFQTMKINFFVIYLFEIFVLLGISYLIFDMIILSIYGKNIEIISKTEKVPPSNRYLRNLYFIWGVTVILGSFVTIFSDEEYFIEAMLIGWFIVLLISIKNFKNKRIVRQIEKVDLHSLSVIPVFYGISLIFYGIIINEYIVGILFGGLIVIFSIIYFKFNIKFLQMIIIVVSILSLIIFELERELIDFLGEIMLLCTIFSIFIGLERYKYKEIEKSHDSS